MLHLETRRDRERVTFKIFKFLHSQHCHLLSLPLTLRKVQLFKPLWLFIDVGKDSFDMCMYWGIILAVVFKRSNNDRNTMQFDYSNCQIMSKNKTNQFYSSKKCQRRGKRTKTWAVCSSLFFYALSLSSEVIVGDSNKSNSAVLSLLPLFLSVSLSTLPHRDGSGLATLWAWAFIMWSDVCPQDDR